MYSWRCLCLILMNQPRAALLQDTETALGCTEGCHSSALLSPDAGVVSPGCCGRRRWSSLALSHFQCLSQENQAQRLRRCSSPWQEQHSCHSFSFISSLHWRCSSFTWVLWLWSEIIHDKRKKIMCLDQTKKKDFRNLAEMRETKQLVWGWPTALCLWIKHLIWAEVKYFSSYLASNPSFFFI